MGGRKAFEDKSRYHTAFDIATTAWPSVFCGLSDLNVLDELCDVLMFQSKVYGQYSGQYVMKDETSPSIILEREWLASVHDDIGDLIQNFAKVESQPSSTDLRDGAADSTNT